MALSISLLTSGIDTTNNPASTASVNPTSGSVTYLFVAYAVAGGGNGNDGDSITPSGARGTWTEMTQVWNPSSRRGMFLFRGTGTVTNEAISLSVSAAGGTWTETAWNVIEVTGQDATPDDAVVIADSLGSTQASTADVGTVDTGDAVLFGVWHETDEAVTATGFTGLGAVTGGSDVRTLHTFYDDTTPDETPQTDTFTSSSWGMVAFVVNVGAGGGSETGTGAITLGAITTSGSAMRTETGTGAISLGHVTVAGTATRSGSGTGAITLGPIAVAGVAEREINSSGGGIELLLGTLLVSGSGGVGSPGTGAVVLGALTVAGTAERAIPGSGAITLGPLQVVGTQAVAGSSTGTGSITLGILTASGAAIRGLSTTGAIVLGALTVRGGSVQEFSGPKKYVYVVSASGRTKWTHYLPVQYVVPANLADIGTWNADGGLAVQTLSSVSGLVEWVDYIPIVVTGTVRGTSDDTGYVPVVETI